jgi:cell wall-associated NlpC family hydrolase
LLVRSAKRLLCLALLAGIASLATWFASRLVSVPAASTAIRLPADFVGQLEAGDVIFRIGEGWRSDAVRGMGGRQEKRGDPYSHVGLLVGGPSRWQVLHAVPAELPGRADAVVLDDLDFFLAPERAHGVAIYRVTADASARAAAVEAAMERLGTPFRIVEDDQEGQYCTTLIWRVWQSVGVDLGARFEWLEIPFATGQYLLPHSLRTAPGLKLLFEAQAGR